MDHFLLFFTLSVLMLGLCLLIAFRQRQKPHTFFTPYRLAMMGIFVGAFLLFVPYYLSFFREEPVAELCAKTVLMAAHPGSYPGVPGGPCPLAGNAHHGILGNLPF